MIEIQGLAKVYADGKEALSGVDLCIGDGMLGLLGPNGSGKTTFLSLLTLVLEPTRGSRRYDGLDAARRGARAEIRRLIGYLPQDFAPIGHLTGFEYVVHCARLRGMAGSRRDVARRARDLLDAVTLGEAADRASGGYSGGMRRRLGIAQALVHRPRLLVVDEPTAGLDPEERIRFRNLIADIADDTAVLLSTHIVEDIEAICPRIAIIASGRLLYDGDPTALLQKVAGALWEVSARAPLPRGALVVGRRAAGGAAVAIVHHEQAPAGAAAREPTLEDAYACFLMRRGHALEDAAAS